MKKGFLRGLKKYKGKPRLIESELKSDLGSRNIIFVGSAIDLFGEWVSEDTIRKILSRCRNFQNTYLFQSKNPARFNKFLHLFPEKTILGTTLETNRDYKISQAPKPLQRFQDFLSIEHTRKMVSIEPIMDFDKKLIQWVEKIEPEFVSIGADSKNNDLDEPEYQKIKHLIDRLKEITEIRKKKNLGRLIG